MRLIIGCTICSLVFVIILRFTLKRRVNGQKWKLQKNKTPIDRWFLFGVRNCIPPTLFIMHLLLSVAIVVNFGLGVFAYQFAKWKLYNAICTSSVFILAISVIMIEPARHFQSR